MEPSPNDVEAYQKWVECMDRGAGELYLAIEDDQKHHLGGFGQPDEDVGAVEMWKSINQTRDLFQCL